MPVINAKTAKRLEIKEEFDHVDSIEREVEVRVGVKGYGPSFEEIWETKTRKIYNVPVAYNAEITLEGVPVLRYYKSLGEKYADLVEEENSDNPDDILCDDEDALEWIWCSESTGFWKRGCWLGEYLMYYWDGSSYFDGDASYTLSEIADMDAPLFDSIQVLL